MVILATCSRRQAERRRVRCPRWFERLLLAAAFSEDVCDEYVALNDRIALVDILAELKHERGGVLECKEPLEEFYASSLGF